VKLVVIHGAPGVGKLTTARALAALTGFRVFHNHLTFDLAKAVFDFPTPPFVRLAETVRLATLEAAAREGLPGLIFTFGYASPEDDGFVERVIQVVERHGGALAFVRLYCDTATHEQRILGDERRRFGKITSVESLRGALARWNFAAAIRAGETLEIDNSTLEADEVARRIASHFSLPVR
jgi:chloramphenicol 3-O-phosphotransferase